MEWNGANSNRLIVTRVKVNVRKVFASLYVLLMCFFFLRASVQVCFWLPFLTTKENSDSGKLSLTIEVLEALGVSDARAAITVSGKVVYAARTLLTQNPVKISQLPDGSEVAIALLPMCRLRFATLTRFPSSLHSHGLSLPRIPPPPGPFRSARFGHAL